MLRTIATGVTILAGAWSAAPAGELSNVRLKSATIEYDRDHWRVAPATDDRSLVFTCIAADCPEQPMIFATAQPLSKADGDLGLCETPPLGGGHDISQTVLPAEPKIDKPRLPFSAYSIWSGCRAMDNPLFEACAEFQGVTYRLANHLGYQGCNFGPELPAERFMELLDGVRPASP